MIAAWIDTEPQPTFPAAVAIHDADGRLNRVVDAAEARRMTRGGYVWPG
jgi:hypothetical protein